MAMARVVWASKEIEPYDMAPVQNRLTMFSADSTSSSGISLHPSKLKSKRPLHTGSQPDIIIMRGVE
jgi:hypothetical protein